MIRAFERRGNGSELGFSNEQLDRHVFARWAPEGARLHIVLDDHLDGNHSGGAGWIKISPNQGVLVTLRGKTRWLEVGRGDFRPNLPRCCPRKWIRFGRIARGLLFRRIFKNNKTVDVERLRQACRPPGQADRTCRRRPFRCSGSGACAAVLGQLAARRSCLFG